MHISHITSDDFREAVKNNPLVILPLGATEAHGSHLPLCADTLQSEFLSEKIAEKLDNILIAPSVNFGLHSSTKNMPGTINITFDTLRSLVYDILKSLNEQGINKIMVISGHAGSGHLSAISEACKKIVIETEMHLIFFADYDLATKSPKCAGISNDGHGGCVETSRVLAIRPDLVKDSRPIGIFEDQGYTIVSDASVCMPEGIAGDTTKATAEMGKAINDNVIESIIRMIKNEFE